MAVGGDSVADALDLARPQMIDTLKIAHGLTVLALGVSMITLFGSMTFGALLPAVGLRLPRISRDVMVGAAHGVWILIWLQEMGVNLTGILATSAVVTVVIGLSMQDTLGNLISGLAMQMEGTIQVGDWVRVDDIRGRIIETRWRSTSIETTNWETVIIPNSVLVKSKLSLLGRRQGEDVQWRRWIYFNVDYRYSPNSVIEAVEKGVRSARIDRVATHPPPNCVQTDFADSYARYAVRYFLTELAADDPTDSDVRTHIYFALRRAGISPSIPAAAVFLTEESAERAASKADSALKDRVEALHGIDIFKDLPHDEIRRLAESVTSAPFARGEIMTMQGSEAHWMYLILRGTADVLVENETGHSAKVAELGPGTYFGEWGCMTGEPRDATVVAATRVDCYRLDKDAFRELIQARPQLAGQLSEVIARRRTERMAVLQHLDEEATSAHLNRTHNFVLESVRRMFGITD